MAMGPDRRHMTDTQAHAAEIDVGLRKYMLGVYNYMCIAMVMTGLTAYGLSLRPDWVMAMHSSALIYVVIFAPLVLVFFLAARIHTMKVSTAQMVFWIYAVLVGLSLSSIFLVYQGTSIARVFFITATAFAGMSLFGYTTKRNLQGLGTFFFMALIGLIVAMVINMIWPSGMMTLLISVAGVLLFAGLTAYDTQQIKLMYNETDGSDVMERKSILGALKLYLDFLNMFIFLLHIMGVARE